VTHSDVVPAPLLPPTPVGSSRADSVADAAHLAALRTDALPTIALYRAAANLARQLYAPAIARVVRGELDAWCEWGHRIRINPVVGPLYEQVMADARDQGLA